MSYKSARNNNFIESKKVKLKYIGCLQEPQKKTTSCKKGTQMSLKYKENKNYVQAKREPTNIKRESLDVSSQA